MTNKNRRANADEGGKEPGGKTWQERKLEKVNRDDIDVISRKTMDQGDFIVLHFDRSINLISVSI